MLDQFQIFKIHQKEREAYHKQEVQAESKHFTLSTVGH